MTAPAVRRSDSVSAVEADDFRKRHGYPIDAKRLPAGRYRIVGVDAYNQTDETSPDGVRLWRRGDVVQMSEHEASRLLFLGVIDDPDAPPREVAKSTTTLSGVQGEMKAMLEQMRAQIDHHRESRGVQLPSLARSRTQAQEAVDLAAAKLAEIEARIAQAEAEQTATDEELAESFGPIFLDTFRRLETSLGAEAAR